MSYFNTNEEVLADLIKRRDEAKKSRIISYICAAVMFVCIALGQNLFFQVVDLIGCFAAGYGVGTTTQHIHFFDSVEESIRREQ